MTNNFQETSKKTNFFQKSINFQLMFSNPSLNHNKVDQFPQLPLLLPLFPIRLDQKSFTMSLIIVIFSFEDITATESVLALALLNSVHPFTNVSENKQTKIEYARQMSSMIRSARPTLTSVATIIFCCFGLLDLKSDGRTICAKIMITTGRNCGSAEWINNRSGKFSDPPCPT